MFWFELEKHKGRLAVVDGDQQLTYSELALRCDAVTGLQSEHKKLVFVFASNDLTALVAYLACLRKGHACMLIDPNLTDTKLKHLFELYKPHAVMKNGVIESIHNENYLIDERLAVLLSTSGSTGTAKHVALSFDNLQSNATAICQYLPIQNEDKTIVTLPLFYSYGLSVINSHLAMGATICFTSFSFVNRQFWEFFKQQQISSFASVPHGYDMLLRIKFSEMQLPSLRYFTLAGGKLDARKVTILADYAQRFDKPFFVMYGQTEATARMAYLPPEMTLLYPDAIGFAIPYGEFELVDNSGEIIDSANSTGEIVYKGPNIMLGYVNSYHELFGFNPLSRLFTGDLGYYNEDGIFFISGRIKRILKLHGKRISLDEIEEYCQRIGYDVFCVGSDKKLVVAIQNREDEEAIKSTLIQYLALHGSMIRVLTVSSLPFTPSGKKDYAAIQILIEKNDAE